MNRRRPLRSVLAVICAWADNANKLSAPRARDAESVVSLDIGPREGWLSVQFEFGVRDELIKRITCRNLRGR